MANKYSLLLFFALLHQASFAGSIKVGTGKVNITPDLPFYLSGYAVRTTPAETKVHDLWAKALVLEENAASRIVIITTDVLGLTSAITETVANRAQKKYGITRSQIVFNSSHTHSGPMIWPALSMIGDYDAATIKIFAGYAMTLTDQLMQAIDMAMQHLVPMTLSYGNGTAGFAANRRQFTPKGVVNGVNPDGPVDRDVPVLVAKNEQGKVKAILFGYACHNTTVTSNHNIVNGDYAGFAQIELEKIFPEATALFFIGCAGDQNPMPRGTLELAEKHGKELADAVQAVLAGKTEPVGAPLRSAYVTTELNFEPVDREKMEKDLADSNRFVQRRARLIMEADSRGWNISIHRYPVQAVRLGNKLTILALSGETVVDYSLKTKKAFASEQLFVAGYCNQVVCYIPTKKILAEGGYEAVQNMIYYGMPGPFKNNVEEKVLAAISTVMLQVGVQPGVQRDVRKK
jgi:neutral ceramidase